MTTLREEFHALGNWLNKISMASILAKESITDKDLSQGTAPELKKTLAKVVELLDKIGGYVEGADGTLSGIKPFLYERVGPTTGFEAKKTQRKFITGHENK